MSWQQVGSRRYYYRHERKGGKSRRVYVGAAGNPAAELVATAADLRRLEREAGRRELRAEVARLCAAEAAVQELCELADALAGAALVLNGFRRHDRGAWRKCRDNGNANRD
jgi:hypothetical protein